MQNLTCDSTDEESSYSEPEYDDSDADPDYVPMKDASNKQQHSTPLPQKPPPPTQKSSAGKKGGKKVTPAPPPPTPTQKKQENWDEHLTVRMYEYASQFVDILHPPPGSQYFKRRHPEWDNTMKKVQGMLLYY